MWEGYQWIDLNEYMGVQEEIAVVHVEKTRKIGVKTKNGCEDPFPGQISPPGPRGGSYILIFGKLIGFERQYFAIPPAKVAVYTLTARR